MNQEIKAELQIFFVLLVVTGAFIFLLATIKTETQLQTDPASTTGSPGDGGLIVIVEKPTDPSIPALDSVEPLDSTGVVTYYFPFISKFPTPTPPPILYYEDFSNDDDQERWGTGESSDCEVEYRDGRYRVRVKDDDDDNDICFGPAPGQAEYQYGEFEVKARRVGGSDEFRYGVYINGRGGGEYYLFQIDYDEGDCDWTLVRTEDDDDEGIASASCNASDTGPNSYNTLRIKHSSDGRITLYLNDQQLTSIIDSSQLTGRGTGVYVREMTTSEGVTVEFDDYTIYNR